MTLPVMFESRMSDGSMVCTNVSFSIDGLIECEENITVELTLDTVKDSLSLGENTTTVVTLQDSDGKCLKHYFVQKLTEFYHTAASYTILPIQIIAENNSVLEVCVTMMTSPSGGTLTTDVDLTLTPISDTGS